MLSFPSDSQLVKDWGKKAPTHVTTQREAITIPIMVGFEYSDDTTDLQVIPFKSECSVITPSDTSRRIMENTDYTLTRQKWGVKDLWYDVSE